MLGCCTLSLLSLSLTLSVVVVIIIIIIIITIISIINSILDEKEKAMGWEGGFTNKTVWTCSYACYLCTSVLFVWFWVVSCKKIYVFLEFTIVFVNLIMKIKIKKIFFLPFL